MHVTWSCAAVGLSVLTIPTPSVAQSLTAKFTANFTKAASSINPPNPVECCDKAKKEAIKLAVSKGYKGKVEWEHLSVDSDCKLDIQGAGRLGYYYIFTAAGLFYRRFGRASLQVEHLFA